jgi:hypothetical protein
MPLQTPDAEGVTYDQETGKWEQVMPDGGVMIFDHDPSSPQDTASQQPTHNDNLADILDEATLHAMCSDILDAIEEDDTTRRDWLAQRSKALDMLGLKIESPRGDAGSAPIDGMSTIRHPLLNDACIHFQANARGELLPSDGPVKIKNTNGSGVKDVIAEQLEECYNTFLTVTATEYVPDTDKLFFQVGYSGAGFKKGYHCPLRRRPTIESVDAKDLIVSNTATDLDSAQRITHVIKMSPDVMIRMQLAGAYRVVSLALPDDEVSELDRQISSVQGISATSNRPQDADHTVYECHCNYNIPGYEHKSADGKETGLPLPYKVVIERSSRKILEIRRNWREEDTDCKRRRCFVMYPFIPMFGFYPSGFLHILGNTENALTAAWRIMLDNGMYNNFPTFLYAKGATNNENPTFRAAPGTGIAVDTLGKNLSDSVMPVPFKELNPVWMAFVDAITQAGQRMASVSDLMVGEGRQDAPVGTTLALIEQQTKVMSGIHKRLHSAQAHEFQMLKELFLEDPEALWRHRKDGSRPWNADQLLMALADYDLIPVADPNTPSHMHRMMKASALAQRADMHPERYDLVAVEHHILRCLDFSDPDSFLSNGPPPGTQPNAGPSPLENPHAIRAISDIASTEMKARYATQAAQLKAQGDEANRRVKLLDIQQRAKDKAADRASKEAIAHIGVAERLATHPLTQGAQPTETII